MWEELCDQIMQSVLTQYILGQLQGKYCKHYQHLFSRTQNYEYMKTLNKDSL